MAAPADCGPVRQGSETAVLTASIVITRWRGCPSSLPAVSLPGQSMGPGGPMLWQSALCIAVVAVLGLSGGDVVAQGQWPTRPVKFVVPAPPGGGTDLYARLLASELSESLKQSFVVENRPGAGGNIGAEVVAKAPADGHTFLVSATGTVAVNPILYRNLPFDVERDLVPVARGVTGPFAFIAHAALP